ncbi:MAG: Gfo/Idh/MocA family oxidoreductase [Planctomycetes bacterium]|nr:Gfo/Idh/MocA family oxidoreductase [Planctomycetota bacterium]
MSTATYRAGIIGLGFIGAADPVSGEAIGQQVKNLDGSHVGALTGHPRVRLVAGSSRDAGRRERFTARTSIPTYPDWREMLEREKLDLVSVATDAPSHAEIAIGCAERGVRAVYAEKPIATRPTDADRMIRACEQSGALLVINHNLRFFPPARRLRDFIRSGGLGDLTSASIEWGSGRLGNVGTHFMDAAQMLSCRAIMAVSGTLDTSGRPDCRGPRFRDPGGWGLLSLEGHLRVTVDAADYGRIPARIAVNGSLGRALLHGRDLHLEFWDGRQESWPKPEDGRSSMDRAVSEIVAWLDGAGAFPVWPAEAVRTLEAIVGFHASNDHRGAWVELPLTGDDRGREVLSG